MKKLLTILLITSLLTGCQKKLSAGEISKINGYWEIEKVIFANGSTKDYKINEMFDFFDIENNNGFRKKVTPQFDGTFLVNDASEKVTIKEVDGIYFLNYSTAFSKWKEELLMVSDKELITRNVSKDEYHYKRATPINLTGNGKEVQ